MVKGSSPAVYYVAADGKRLAFPDEATYFSWYKDFSDVQVISDEELASLPLGGLVTVRPGTKLVKTVLSPKVYAVGHGGVLCWLSTEEMARMIFGLDWSEKVMTVPDEFLTAYRFGMDINAGGQYWWRLEQEASADIDADRDPSAAPESLEAPPEETEPVSLPEESEEIVPDIQEEPAEEQAAEPEGPTPMNTLYVLWDPQRLTDAAPDKAALQRFLFGPEPSLADYYEEESDGHIAVKNAGVLGWYKADKPPEHYWSDDEIIHSGDGFKTGKAERIAEALKKADVDFDFSAYDVDGNGNLEMSELAIFVVIPQTSSDPTSEEVTPQSAEDPSSEAFEADGVAIGKVVELHIGSPLGEAPQFGTIIYSFAKYVLGLADMTSSSSDIYSPGSFSLMSDHYSYARLDPYNRINLGWATPTVIPEDVEQSHQDLNSIIPDREIIKVKRGYPASSSEYFLIENRQRGVYDGSLPDTGIAIWDVNGSTVRLLHLDDTVPINEANALWHKRGGTYNAPTGLELFWPSDGVRSGVQLLNVGESGQVMSFTLIKAILTEYEVRPLESPIQ